MGAVQFSEHLEDLTALDRLDGSRASPVVPPHPPPQPQNLELVSEQSFQLLLFLLELVSNGIVGVAQHSIAVSGWKGGTEVSILSFKFHWRTQY